MEDIMVSIVCYLIADANFANGCLMADEHFYHHEGPLKAYLETVSICELLKILLVENGMISHTSACIYHCLVLDFSKW
jgi:hypothetical protein